MGKSKRLLVVVGSIDAAEIGAGGTMIKAVEKGYEVVEAVLSRGELISPTMSAEELGRVREMEQRESARIVGVKEVRFYDWGDACQEESLEHKLELVRLIREIRPEVVITHWPGSKHPGFRTTSRLVTDAAFLAGLPGLLPEVKHHVVRKLYQFAIRSWSGTFEPTIFVDISTVMEKKREALRAHRSMWSLPGRTFGSWFINYLSMSKLFGYDSGVEYAEGFVEHWLPTYHRRALDFLPI